MSTRFLHPQSENTIPFIVESDASQLSRVLERLDDYDAKFAKQERTIEGLLMTNEGLQKTIGNMQKTIDELSANSTRVSYTSSFMTPAQPVKPPFIANTNTQRSPSPSSAR